MGKYFPESPKVIKEVIRQQGQKDQIESSVNLFSQEMKNRLLKHLDRPGWEKANGTFLFTRLCDEVIELDIALFANNQVVRRKNKKQIIKECADVANFAMMIADNLRK